MENENDKFIKCLNENKRLKQQLKELKDENFTCKEKLEIHQYTIELLQKENKMLRHRIKKLENDNKISNEKIKSSDEKIKLSDEKIKFLEFSVEEIDYISSEKIKNLENKESILNKKIKKLEDNESILNKKINALEDNESNLNKKINELYEEKKYKSAVFKLHEINAIANSVFKFEYRKFFNIDILSSSVNIPNIGTFIRNPPKNGKNYDFWCKFIQLYPGSDNIHFDKIYKQLNKFRMSQEVHPIINDITEEEFIELTNIVLPNMNKEVINNYRKWLYSFPFIDE